MKKIIIILIILGCLNITAKAQFGGGLGTESSPYEIYTKAHLEELADSVNAGNSFFEKFFVQKQDINEPVTNPIGYIRIGSPKDSSRGFSGNFNGENYKITLNIDNKKSLSGLFGYINNATIHNVITTGYVNGESYTAAIVGWADSSNIFHCISMARVDAGSSVAGIVGVITNGCKISFCQNLGAIEGYFCVGGIVGHAGWDDYDGTNGNIVSHSVNAGYIKGKMGGISGIVGHLGNWQDEANTTVIFCINVGVVEGPPQRVSGIANIPE